MARISVAQRRSDFINAAVEVIAVHGIDGATTRRIAEQAQANLAMLHYCYDSKEDLFADVYEFVAGRYRDLVKSSDPHSTLVDTARQLLRGVMEWYLESPSFTAAALELINWARRQHGERGIAVYDQALETVRAALRGAASEHPLEAETIDQIAYVIATLADGFALNWLTYGDRAAATEQMETAVSVLESWLAARLGTTPVAQ
ncbi:TetR/AcrR family transcriptional regulator [Streptomyces diastatochromogenes]|uniref:TetR family transcriptional regulator n=1 Tax=Streptomyces diastatochromogenes TaxID=42236 RepID=A0A233S9A3_STRDA|nr:TetR/AcrR family transcriptional regulator [Streptomyces diastatochromogenes]MCZ0991077.1 TetR/AcrR family transcriptional regulator [Streptomyces diastatochromogenes]OXY92270.1 TetR family transcriptional regulator [Streptomyces diastatochromogenes]